MSDYYIDGINVFNAKLRMIASTIIENGYEPYNAEEHKLLVVFTNGKKKVNVLDTVIEVGKSAYTVGILQLADKDKINDNNAKTETLDFVVINNSRKFRLTWFLHLIFALSFVLSKQFTKCICEDEKDDTLDYASGLFAAYLSGKMIKKLIKDKYDSILQTPELITPVQLMNNTSHTNLKELVGLDGAYRVVMQMSAGRQYELLKMKDETAEELRKVPLIDSMLSQVELANTAVEIYSDVVDMKKIEKTQYIEFKNSIKRYLNKFR